MLLARKEVTVNPSRFIGRGRDCRRMMKNNDFEMTNEQKIELEKKFRELLEICQINRTPFFATCAISNDDQQTKYMSVVYSAQSHSILLTDDRIRKHMLIANGGFDVVPKREVIDLSPLTFAHADTDIDCNPNSAPLDIHE